MKILVCPSSSNPYLEKLYGHISKEHPKDKITYFDTSTISILTFPILITLYRLKGYKIIHIHWLIFSINPKHKIPLSKLISYLYSIICISLIKLVGFKLVWTVHNVVPHERMTLNDVSISRYLARISSKKIVHSQYTIMEMKGLNINVDNIEIIPIGNYLDIYKKKITKIESRRILHIKKGEFVILFFGLIRKYKGVEDLIYAFNKIDTKNVKLIIAGRCEDEGLLDYLKTSSQRDNIDFYEGYVRDDDVSLYFEASNVVCLPFRQITTSASAILSLSMNRSIIVPRIGTIMDLPVGIGYTYLPNNKQNLVESIKKAIIEDGIPKNFGSINKKYLNSISWGSIADKTYELYESI